MLAPVASPAIGCFDSGVGGLSVARSLRALLPSVRLVYFADTAWFPYGGRPPAEVRKRAFAAARALLDAGSELIVVACNTASAAALQDLRAAFPVPFVGMVPGLKPAAVSSRNGRVAVLATPGTLDGELLRRVQEEYGAGVTVERVAGHGLAELVEQGRAATPEVRVRLRQLLTPAIERGADVIVLGCTHYHFLADDVRSEFPGVEVVETSEPVARRAAQLWLDAGRPKDAGDGGLELLVSGPRRRFEEVARSLVPELFAAEARTAP